MDTPQTPPSPTPDPVANDKKTMSTGAKVGIGCSVLFVIGVIVMILLVSWCNKTVGTYMKDFKDNPERASAEFMINMNPELDLLETNDEDGTITFRDKEGKITTMSWGDLAEGKLTISDSEGNEMTFGGGDMASVPEWVPRLPETTQVAASHHAVDNGKISGSYMAGTTMTTETIETFLAEQAEALGMEVALDSRHAAGEQEMRMIGYKGGGRGFSATIIRETAGEAQVQFIYEQDAER